MDSKIKKILKKGETEDIRALFGFNGETEVELIVKKFNIWIRYFFPQFLKGDDGTIVKDAPFHRKIDYFNALVYTGQEVNEKKVKFFIDIVFRGGAKTTRTKLFIAFAIANDFTHYRKYFKILSADQTNSKQFTTDIYNLLVETRIKKYYPEIFEKTTAKREETMGSFTTSTGIKLLSGTVGTDQRGQIQDESRPDFIVYDDFETRKTLKSAVTTKSIWDNMEEAKTGLSKSGGSVYLCNYISEAGNVHKLVQKKGVDGYTVLIVPIIDNGVPAWKDRDTVKDIESIKADAEDFAGEYLCEPSASHDATIDRKAIERQKIMQPIREVAGLRIYYNYDPSHRYGLGGDIAGGVGLDSSTTVIIDFSTVPARVVATYDCNTIIPSTFGHEVKRQGDMFGECIVALENNKFDEAIGVLKTIYNIDRIFKMEHKAKNVDDQYKKQTQYGWQSNALTKPQMIFSLKKAVEDGLIELNDERLIMECKSHTRNDLMDREVDARLTTRHFDLFTGCCISWQMKDHATIAEDEKFEYNIEEMEDDDVIFNDIGL